MITIYMGFIGWFLIVLAIAIVVGLAIFFSTGIYHVRKGRIYIIEKYNEYYKTLEPGWYYFMPLVYHRRAWYKTDIQVQTFHLNNGNVINLYYRIADVAKYHYTAIKVFDKLMDVVNNNDDLDDQLFREAFQEIGLEYIKVERASTNV
ncbi:MAG: hypothetical protein LUC31_00025 [Coprobacillus sp.]|nr:hypothetical protein [Coprobacillus sp.]